jgi:SpoVK/Ycf46/Vps4 family AAA+-type ATPase
MGEEFSMEQCFARARQESPCVLILEDLDSLINPSNRSFFLNQVGTHLLSLSNMANLTYAAGRY